MNQERRLLLAVLLSMIVVYTWQILYPPPKPRVTPPITDTTVVTSNANLLDSDSVHQLPSLFPAVPAGEEEEADEAPMRRLLFEVGGTRAELVETGATVSRLELTQFETVHPSRETSFVQLISPATDGFAAFSLQMDQDDRSGLGLKAWRVVDDWETGARFAIRPRIAELPPGIEIRKEYQFDSRYGMKFVIEIENTTSAEIALSTARMDLPLHLSSREGGMLLYLGPDLGANDPHSAHREQYLVSAHFYKEGSIEGMIWEKSWWHSIAGLPDPALDVEWVSMENRYFVLALKPRDFKVDASLERDRQGRLHQWILLPVAVISPGATHTYAFDVYAGPKETQRLTTFNPALRPLDGMEPSILPKNISIARMMVSFLAWIHGYVGNWGWSIVILTIIVRGLLFPLSHYQFKAMAKMQALKPKIEDVQTRYAADKERLQRELMKVYSEAGVNPLGGCLPILMQMPILIGLFIAFQNAIDLRGVPFILWIGDLSIPDTLFYLLGIPINPLPLLMAATMFFQQKLSPMPSTDPMQRQMLYMMPILMTVLFYNFPSGLSLYWVTQNVLSIGQQYYMMRIREVPSK